VLLSGLILELPFIPDSGNGSLSSEHIVMAAKEFSASIFDVGYQGYQLCFLVAL
jgi:hypothetical protein